MVKCLFTGQVNSGKTALIMSLARYNSAAQIVVEQAGATESFNIASLLSSKISATAYHTDRPEHYYFLMGYNGQYYKYDMIDTIGLIDDIYSRVELRNSVWEVFYHLSQCDILVHTINAVNIAESNKHTLLDVENEILGYQIERKCPLVICATFCDLYNSKKGINLIRKAFPYIPVIALSNTSALGVNRLNKLLTSYAAQIKA